MKLFRLISFLLSRTSVASMPLLKNNVLACRHVQYVDMYVDMCSIENTGSEFHVVNCYPVTHVSQRLLIGDKDIPLRRDTWSGQDGSFSIYMRWDILLCQVVLPKRKETFKVYMSSYCHNQQLTGVLLSKCSSNL